MKKVKVLLYVEIYDDKIKQKAMTAVSSFSGVDSVSVDLKNQKLTLTGDIDPVVIVDKLRKLCRTEILSVGPTQEEKKNKEPKKEEKKKNKEPKKEEKKQNKEPKKEEKKKNKEPEKEKVPKKEEKKQNKEPKERGKPNYYYTSMEEDPNTCTIC